MKKIFNTIIQKKLLTLFFRIFTNFTHITIIERKCTLMNCLLQIVHIFCKLREYTTYEKEILIKLSVTTQKDTNFFSNDINNYSNTTSMYVYNTGSQYAILRLISKTHHKVYNKKKKIWLHSKVLSRSALEPIKISSLTLSHLYIHVKYCPRKMHTLATLIAPLTTQNQDYFLYTPKRKRNKKKNVAEYRLWCMPCTEKSQTDRLGNQQRDWNLGCEKRRCCL